MTRPALVAVLALLSLLGLASPAHAAPRDAGAVLVAPFFAALFAYPLGLAVHCLILAYAPRRGVGLVHNVEAHRWKTLVLGLAHTAFLLLVFAAAAEHAPALAALVLTLWCMLALVGTFGLARSIGARVLGANVGAGDDDLKALAVGWFVLVFASAFPGLGWLLWAYWAVRATGGVILTLFSVPPGPAGPSSP